MDRSRIHDEQEIKSIYYVDQIWYDTYDTVKKWDILLSRGQRVYYESANGWVEETTFSAKNITKNCHEATLVEDCLQVASK